MSARSKGGGGPASSDVQGSGKCGEASEPIGSQFQFSAPQIRGGRLQSWEEQQAYATKPVNAKKRKTDIGSAFGLHGDELLQAIEDAIVKALRVPLGPNATTGCTEDVRSLRAEVEEIRKGQTQLTQLMNTVMTVLRAPRQETGASPPLSGNSAFPRGTAETSNKKARPLSAQVTQPSWANITESGAGTGWTTVTNGKKKLKKHPRGQRRVLFVRNVQSHDRDPRDIMFEVNKALAHSRAHVTVRLTQMAYTGKGNLTGVMSENACADELLSYAPAVMTAVKKLDPEVAYMEKTEKWLKLRVHGVALDRYMGEGGMEVAREEIELMTGERLPYAPRWIKGDTLAERFDSGSGEMRQLQGATPGNIEKVPRKEIKSPDSPAKGERDAQQPAGDGIGSRERRSLRSWRSGRYHNDACRPRTSHSSTSDPDVFGQEHTRATAAEPTVTPTNKGTPAKDQTVREGDPDPQLQRPDAHLHWRRPWSEEPKWCAYKNHRYVFEERTDLVDSPHIQCLDVWETVNRRKARRTRLVNVYNKARVQGGGYTMDHVDVSRLIEGRTILAGDFNARSPLWDPWVAGRQNAGTVERLIEKRELIINNNDHQPTRCGKNCRSIIDLTLSTRRVGALVTWEIDESLATTSDHEVIVFEWAPLNAAVAERQINASQNWNINRLCSDEQALEAASEHWLELSEGRSLINAWDTSPTELEAEALWIQDSLRAVLDRHAAGRAPRPRSKHWWTEEIKQQRRLFGSARRAYNDGRTSFDEYRRVRNDYYTHIRKAKRLAWERFLEGVFPTDESSKLASDPARCWQALRYTKPQVPSHTPAIKVASIDGQPDKIASTAEEKEGIFMAQAFPPQVVDNEDIQIPDTSAGVSVKQVREALFTQSVNKAPGLDGIGFKVLRLLWQWAEDRVVALVQGCIRTGFHPYTWKTAKGVLLRKQNKPTYSVAKAYRVISLLNCLGKVVERAVAIWIASYCETNEVFHRGQFGCRQGRGTSDAVAQLVAKVENAWSQKRIALALLLDVKGAFDRVNKQKLLLRMIQVGMAGNIVRWVNSFLSDRRAMLVIDGRTGETRSIQAGLPQGSPISPVLFILSVSAMFQWLEDRHMKLQAISFVDDIGLVTECDDVEEGARKLEHIARDAIQWGSDNKADFEVSKTEVLVFSRRRGILQATKDAAIRIGEQTFAVKQEATKWLGFWLDSKLSFKTHFENRIASAKGALQRVSSLSRSNGGLSADLMRRVVVAAVTSVALYGSEIWWRGQKDRVKKVQLLLNSQARAITGLLTSTPLAFLRTESCLPTAQDLLDRRQTSFAVRALNANGDHPTHQLLPANFRLGELYRHEGATGQPSSIGWMRAEKTHRSFGSRLAQQVARHVSYDTEYGFELPRKVDSPTTSPVIRTQGYSQMPQRMQPDNPQQLTLFVSTTKDVSFGLGIAWRECRAWKTKMSSLGNHITTADAAIVAISMGAKNLIPILSRTNHLRAEIVTESRVALAAIQSSEQWTPPVVTGIKRHAHGVEEAGGRVVLTWLSNCEDVEGYKIARAAAQRAAKQQPKEMRSASLSYVKQAIKERWKPTAKMNKHIEDARKSVAARYLQLKSGHAVTGAHLLRIGKVKDAQCWWCGESSQTVAHLLLECRKWRRQRDTMLRKLRARKLSISRRRNLTKRQRRGTLMPN
ncbi:hypothetical protein KC353_g8529 [Hortaea werneckii]|nr:hypothetical protein KC353_g8529 [Hortaea werneckii]